MRHYPVFLDVNDREIVVSGAGDAALAKLRLILKTSARIRVFGAAPEMQIRQWHRQGRLLLTERPLQSDDFSGAALFFAANADDGENLRVAKIARQKGILVNIVDELQTSDFITPAIIDRDPVVVAIGTEGSAPVLARLIKADFEARLPANLGILARIGQAFRSLAATLPKGAMRRDFWTRFYLERGPGALSHGGEQAARDALHCLANEFHTGKPSSGSIAFIGAGPGEADLLTLRAHRYLHDGDVIIHDSGVGANVLELARREAIMVETGRKSFGHLWKQEDINRLLLSHARKGANIVRLLPFSLNDYPGLHEEIATLQSAGLEFQLIDGLAASRTREDVANVNENTNPATQKLIGA